MNIYKKITFGDNFNMIFRGWDFIFEIPYHKFIIFCSILAIFFIPAAAAEKSPLPPEGSEVMKFIYSLETTYENINDYTAILIKQERLRGILHREENITFKFKKPFHVYMCWLKGPGEGREILYSPEKNSGRMIINPHGLIGLILPVIYIEPDNPMVKSKSRHTIKEAGIGMSIKNLIRECELAKKEGDLDIQFMGEETLYGRGCLKLEAFFPKGKSYYAHHLVVYIDKEYNLPTHTFIYDWENELLEKASYNELKLNPGFVEIDFDPKNPEYGFEVGEKGN